MSASPGAAGKPEKTMSSRLLTMKFMQRAAASAAVKEAQSGSDDNPPTPKRPRLSSEAGTPGTPQSELDAINAALRAEDEKRREAIARQAAEAGETEWVLDIPAAAQAPQQPLVVAADSLDTEDDVLQGGRQSFGNFKRKSKYVPPPSDEVEGEQRKGRGGLSRDPNAKPPRLSQLTSISGAGGGRAVLPPDSSSKKKNKKKRKS